MCWVMLFCFPLMAAIQEISARIGRVTGQGIAGNIRAHYPRWLLYAIVGLLLVANIINLGADLGAMAAALKLLIGGPVGLYVVGFAIGCTWLEVFSGYERYVSILKWISFVLLAYVAVALVVDVPWRTGPVSHLRAEFLAEYGLRRHRGRGAGHDDHALLLLLAILAGGRGRADRPRRAPAARSAGAGAGADQRGCASTPMSGWATRT